MSIYGSDQEERDMKAIRSLGYEPIDINKAELQARAKSEGMKVFEEHVVSADALFFRAFIDMKIGAGVAKEIGWAADAGITVMELPTLVGERAISVEQTRQRLRELGQR